MLPVPMVPRATGGVAVRARAGPKTAIPNCPTFTRCAVSRRWAGLRASSPVARTASVSTLPQPDMGRRRAGGAPAGVALAPGTRSDRLRQARRTSPHARHRCSAPSRRRAAAAPSIGRSRSPALFEGVAVISDIALVQQCRRVPLLARAYRESGGLLCGSRASHRVAACAHSRAVPRGGELAHARRAL